MSTYGVMFIGCPECGRPRPLRIKLDRYNIGRAMRTVCRACHKNGGVGTQAVRAAELAEDIEWIAASPEMAARRLNTTPEAIARRFYRVGRPDLARPFQRVSGHLRRAKKRVAA